MNVQNTLLMAIKSLAESAVNNNKTVSSEEWETELLDRNIGYALMAIVDTANLLREIREQERKASTRDKLIELAAPVIKKSSMRDDATHGTATFIKDGVECTLDGWLDQDKDGSWAFTADSGDTFYNLDRDKIMFAKG